MSSPRSRSRRSKQINTFKQKRNKKREKEKRRNASRRRQNDEMMMMMRSSRSSHLHPACRTEKKTNTTTTMTTHTKFHAKFERRATPQEKREAVGSTSTTQRGETRDGDAGDDMGDESAGALTRLCLSFVFALHTQADLVLYFYMIRAPV